MENYKFRNYKKKLYTPVGRCFYFKVNNSKLDKPKVLERQVKKIISRLIYKNNIKSNNINLEIGTVEDDFVYNRSRLEISFN